MKRRSHAEAEVLRASVALMRLAGRTHMQIAAACGITVDYSKFIVKQLRKGGMDLPFRGPSREPPAPDRDDILDAWFDGMQARDIALLTRRSLGSVKEIVRRARLAGDVRAIRHPRWPAPFRNPAGLRVSITAAFIIGVLIGLCLADPPRRPPWSLA